ncbi:hypothetical protein JD969_00210 [Planctomycetota bacterium]|nr:hypothetical protein JD969_00210 [Planctomycetota bacterium]
MNKIDPQLVKLIADQVMAALNLQGGNTSPTSQQVTVHPPIGTCTGDYSKFQDDAQPQVVNNLVQNPAHTKPQQSSPVVKLPEDPAAKPLDGFVTADDLIMKLRKYPNHPLVLTARAKLTPLAVDYVKEKQLVLQRQGTTAGASEDVSPVKTNDAKPYAWWTEGFCPVVQKLSNELRSNISFVSASKGIAELNEVVKDMDQMFERTDISGAIIFATDAAKAVLYANKCKNIRAAFSRCPESLEKAKRELGINLLIVEYPYTPADRIESLTETMMASTSGPQPIVEKQIQELLR